MLQSLGFLDFEMVFRPKRWKLSTGYGKAVISCHCK